MAAIKNHSELQKLLKKTEEANTVEALRAVLKEIIWKMYEPQE